MGHDGKNFQVWLFRNSRCRGFKKQVNTTEREIVEVSSDTLVVATEVRQLLRLVFMH